MIITIKFINFKFTGKTQQALIEKISEDAYNVTYTPTKEGPCNVEVTYDGVAVPNRYESF